MLCVPDETAVLRNGEIFAADLTIAVNAELCYVHVSPPKPGDSGDETKKLPFVRSATVITWVEWFNVQGSRLKSHNRRNLN
jgi:hypothetical protein